MSIFGSIQMTDAGGGSGGPLQPGQAVNGVSIDALGRVVLGQEVGAAGDPAELLDNREVPLDNFNIAFPTVFGSEISIIGDNSSLLRLFRGDGNNALLIDFKTKPSPGPQQNGDFWVTIDESFENPDGQLDAVLQLGYNQSGGGGPQKPDEPAMWIAFESHFQASGSAQMEFHLQSAAKDGSVNRHISITPNVNNGEAIGFSEINSYFWKKNNDLLIYFAVDESGGMLLNGPGTSVNWTNTDPTFGQLSFALQPTGTVEISNGTTGPNSTIGFSNGIQVNNPNPLFSSVDLPLSNFGNVMGVSMNGAVTGGNALPVFIQMSVDGIMIEQLENQTVAGNVADILIVAMNPGGPGEAFTKWSFRNGGFEGYEAGIDQGENNIFKIAYGQGTLSSDPGIMSLTPLLQAGFGGNMTPTAWVHINPAGTDPGTGPLKLTAAPLLAVPEDGLIEYDGINFYKTIGAVRTIIA